MRAALIAILALCGIALAGVILTPSLLVVDQYRNKVARFAASRLGRPIHIDGPISLSLLPEPVLSAARVTVGDSGDGVTITAAQLDLRVAIWPLIRGRIDAREVVLRGTDLRVAWPPSRSVAAMRAGMWYGSVGARIEGGTLSIGGLRLTDVAATVSASGRNGIYAATGTARLGGIGWHFDTRLDAFGGAGTVGSGPATLTASLEGQGLALGVAARLVGEVGSDGGLDGRIEAHGPDLSRLLVAPAIPFTLQGRIGATSDRVTANELGVTLDGLPVRTALTLRLTPAPRLDLTLSANELDLDPWLAPLSGRVGAKSPIGLPVGLDIWAETARLGGRKARVVHGAFDVSSAGVEVREARAVLPGDAIFGLKGWLDRAEPAHPRFDGDATLTAPALPVTLDWLERAAHGRATALPDRALRTADLTAHVSGEPGVLALTALQGHVDGSVLSGSLSLRTAGRAVVGAGLMVDRLDLDPWLPNHLSGLLSQWTPFADFDADVRLEAKQANLAGMTATPLLLDVAAEGGQLTLRQLVAEADGLHVAASGSVTGSGLITDARLALQTADAAGLAERLTRWLGPAWRGAALRGLLQGPASLQVQAAGVPTSVRFNASADIAGLHAEFRPTVDLPARRWRGALTLHHPGAPRLASRLGAPWLAAWLGDGSLGLVSQLSGMRGRLWADQFDLAAGSLRADGSLTLTLGQGPPRLTGVVTAETLPLPLLSLRSSEPLPLDLLAGWDAAVRLRADQVTRGVAPVIEQAATTVSLSAGLLKLEALTGTVAGGSLTSRASFASAARPPEAIVEAALSGATVAGALTGLPVDVDGGTLDAAVSLRGFGYAPSVFLATMAGEARVALHDGTLSGLALDRLRTVGPPEPTVDVLSGGSTPFSTFDLAARIRSGVAILERSVMNSPSGEMRLGGRIDLPVSTGDLRFDIRPAMLSPPNIVLHLAGPLDAMRRVPEFAVMEPWHVRAVPVP